MNLDIPVNAFQGPQTVQLTTGNAAALQNAIPSGTQSLMTTDVNFFWLAPAASITLTINNPKIPANATVCK
jgi:hypothetical protein